MNHFYRKYLSIKLKNNIIFTKECREVSNECWPQHLLNKKATESKGKTTTHRIKCNSECMPKNQTIIRPISRQSRLSLPQTQPCLQANSRQETLLMGDNRSMEISHEESVLQNVIWVISSENHPNDPKLKTFYDDLDKRESSPDQEKKDKKTKTRDLTEMGRARGRGRSLPQTMEEGFCRMGLQLGGKRRVPISGISRQWEQPTSPFYQKKKGLSPSPLSLSCCEAQLWYGECVPLNETLCYGLHDVHAPGMLTSVWELDGNKYFHLQRTHQKTLIVISFGGPSWCPCSESILLPVLLLRWSFCFHKILS